MKHIKHILLILVLGFSLLDIHGQCAMCKAVVEDASANVDANIGRGINMGIVYIMFLPWLLLGIGALVFFREKLFALLKSR